MMERPLSKSLTADEARVLLTASALWRHTEKTEIASSRTIFTPHASATTLKTHETGIRESSLEVESLSLVPYSSVVSGYDYPFNTLAFIEYYQNGWYMGQAAIIAPRCLLTSGNNLYYQVDGSMTEEVYVYPGMYPDPATGEPVLPYGSLTTNDDNLWYRQEYVEDSPYEPSEYDYGGIILGDRFSRP